MRDWERSEVLDLEEKLQWVEKCVWKVMGKVIQKGSLSCSLFLQATQVPLFLKLTNLILLDNLDLD